MALTSAWSIVFETASGNTRNATQTLVPLYWERATWTLRRRAPHAFTITIPVHSHHLPTDFKARRELRLQRDGVYVSWGAGFMGAPQVSPAGDDWGPIELPGYGNVMALEFLPYTAGLASGFDTDGLIGLVLDENEHGSGGDWFASAQRTLGTAAITLDYWTNQGKGGTETINELVDIEGWAWRAGINSSGAFTFAASGTVDTDRSATIHAIDRANCRISGVTQDDSRLIAAVNIYSHYPAYRSQLNGALLAGATTITVDTTVGLESGDIVHIGATSTTVDVQTVNVVSSGTQFTITGGGLTYAQADNATVSLPREYYRSSGTIEVTATAEDHHVLTATLFDDTLAVSELRQEMADQYGATYDSVLRSATVETTDPALIAAMLDAGLEPGDSIKLTSNHRYLAGWYAGTTVKVQEMSLELEPGGCRRITLAVGDPRLDDLALLERMVKAGTRAATAYQRTS